MSYRQTRKCKGKWLPPKACEKHQLKVDDVYDSSTGLVTHTAVCLNCADGPWMVQSRFRYQPDAEDADVQRFREELRRRRRERVPEVPRYRAARHDKAKRRAYYMRTYVPVKERAKDGRQDG